MQVISGFDSVAIGIYTLFPHLHTLWFLWTLSTMFTYLQTKTQQYLLNFSHCTPKHLNKAAQPKQGSVVHLIFQRLTVV